MPDEVAPDLFRLPVRLHDSPLGWVNAYAVRNEDGLRLIDTGWNTPDAYASVVEQLQPLGGVAAIREILITHMHPDHYGLAGRLSDESGASVSMHRLEAAYLGGRYEDVRDLVEQMSAWLRVNGAPNGEVDAMTAGSLDMLRRVGIRRPDTLLEGGETLEWRPYTFEVIWTPGHAAGHICLYDRPSTTFVSADHVLERISPHVGLHAQSFGNPLEDYLHALQSLRGLPTGTILPGHGTPFRDLDARIDSLLVHHRLRLVAIRDLLEAEPLTAYELSGRMTWKGSENGWTKLAPFERRMAMTEVLAHLEHLYSLREIEKAHRDGVVRYVAAR